MGTNINLPENYQKSNPGLDRSQTISGTDHCTTNHHGVGTGQTATDREPGLYPQNLYLIVMTVVLTLFLICFCDGVFQARMNAIFAATGKEESDWDYPEKAIFDYDIHNKSEFTAHLTFSRAFSSSSSGNSE